MVLWYEVMQIAQTIRISGEEDNLLWKLESNGSYSVKSLYVVVNFRGILHVYVHKVWDIKVPPKIHFFMWLIAHNRILTRDNLVKKQNVDDMTCVFYNEVESNSHMFFECVVAKAIWKHILHVTRLDSTQVSLEALAGSWEHNKTHKMLNMIIAAVLWSIWLTRNGMCFNRSPWLGLQVIWRKIFYFLAEWSVSLQGTEKENLKLKVISLEAMAHAPPPLLWPDPS
jgi:hypothetical protein